MPPFVGVAVKVTDVPLQIEMALLTADGLDEMLTLTGRFAFTFMVPLAVLVPPVHPPVMVTV